MRPPPVRLSNVVTDSFFSVFRFLARTGLEVEGRTLETPPLEVQEKLRRFAHGRGTPEERASICDLLRTRPDWLKWMVEIVRQNRAASAVR